MGSGETALFVVASLLQIAAIVFAIGTIRHVDDKRPWIVLLTALGLMLAARVLRILFPPEIINEWSSYVAILVSFLLLMSMYYLREVAAAEQASTLAARKSAAERDEFRNRYQLLVDLSPDAVFVNFKGKIIYLNESAVKLLGANSKDHLLGRSPLSFVSGESRVLAQERIDRLLSAGETEPPNYEKWIRADGSLVPVEVTASIVPWGGQKAIQVVMRDVSERVSAEQEKSRLLASERTARSRAEHSSRMKDEFLATLSHELRTPLNAILGWSQLLRRGPSDDAELDLGLETIERNAIAQTRLIEDLLDMSRIISGKLRLDVQSMFPIDFIDPAIAALRPAAEAKGIRLEQILDPLAGPVSADPNRMQQVVWNLLSNAIKFTTRGGKVQIHLARVESHIEVTVADTGQGIAAEFLPYVFDRFRQADSSTSRKHGGLGIGLAIVKQLVELHGGNVSVKSLGEGQGATFSVTLPLSVVHVSEFGGRADPGTPAASSVQGRESTLLAGVKVLVVDDEPDARDLIRRLLENCLAKVKTVASGSDALGALSSEQHDVLISDIGMPRMDGYELIRQVRGLDDEHGGRVPAIALTAFARSDDRTRALLAGYQVHVSKPVEPAELIATVAAVLGRTGKATHTNQIYLPSDPLIPSPGTPGEG
jgi:PAS domain S-box-containing protein